MTRPLYVFDIDGTLVRSFMREGGAEPGAYDRVELLPGRMHRIDEIVHQHPRAGFALATNQAGACLGYQTFDQVRRRVGKVLEAVHFFRGHPVSVQIAWAHPRAKDPAFRADPHGMRKPGPGMLLSAAAAFEVPEVHLRSAVTFIGDMDVDEQAARAAGVNFVRAEAFFDYEGEQVDSHWEDFPNPGGNPVG